MIEVTRSAIAEHPFLRGMPPGHLDALAEVGADVSFPAGHRIFEDGGYAGKFWLIQSGHLALDVQVPGEGRVVIDNVGMGELLGCSWFFPPYRWAFGAVCAGPLQAFEFDARRRPGAVRGRPALRLRADQAATACFRQAAAEHPDAADRQVHRPGSWERHSRRRVMRILVAGAA